MEEVIRNGKPEIAADFYNNQINQASGRQNRLIVPIVAGVALGAWGVLRRDLTGKAMAVAGGLLAYRATSRFRPYRLSVVVSQTINRPVSEVYEFCRNSQNWPRFVQSWYVSRGKDATSAARNSSRFNWNIEVLDEQENELIAWHSARGSAIRHRGTVRFRPAPGNRGTEVSISLYYEAPAGLLSRALGLALGSDPEQQAREGLRALKALMEAGEVPTTVGQPSGRRGLKGKLLKTMYRETLRERAA